MKAAIALLAAYVAFFLLAVASSRVEAADPNLRLAVRIHFA